MKVTSRSRRKMIGLTAAVLVAGAVGVTASTLVARPHCTQDGRMIFMNVEGNERELRRFCHVYMESLWPGHEFDPRWRGYLEQTNEGVKKGRLSFYARAEPNKKAFDASVLATGCRVVA